MTTMVAGETIVDALPGIPQPGRPLLIEARNGWERSGLLAALLRRRAGGNVGKVVAMDLFGPVSGWLPAGMDVVTLAFGVEWDEPFGLGLLDPSQFPNRDACVNRLVRDCEALWDTWTDRDDVLRRAWSALYECNRVARREGRDLLALPDALRLLGADADGVHLRLRAMAVARDAGLRRWLADWDAGAAAAALPALEARIGAWTMRRPAAEVMDVAESHPEWRELVASEGKSLAMSGGAGRIGLQPAALLCSAVVEMALDVMPPGGLLAVDGYDRVAGVDWPAAFDRCRERDISLILASCGGGAPGWVCEVEPDLVVSRPATVGEAEGWAGALGFAGAGDLAVLASGSGYARFRNGNGMATGVGPLPLAGLRR